MADIRHRIGITAPAAEVYEALTALEGLADWWTREVKGQSSPGSELEFYFGNPDRGAVMEVVELTPASRVVWRCVRGPEEWVGTILTFELTEDGSGETVLMFTHADWSEPVPFMHHCSTKWGVHLIGLKLGLEGGTASPYPEDKRISSWG
jgi:uncharacterized protein YndB with AHSA1/START domain